MLMDMTFGFSRQNQHVYGPDFQAGNYGLDVARHSRHERPGQQRVRSQRYAGYPQFNTGFSAVGNRDGWNPIFRDERTYSLSTNLTKVKGRHDIRGGYTCELPLPRSLAAGDRQPARPVHFNGDDDGAARRRPAANFYNQYASFLLGLSARQQERAERADDRARMAARPVRARPVDAQPEADVRPGPALRALSRSCTARTAAASIAST